MNYRIEVYPAFKKEVKRLSKRYPSLKKDIQNLAEELLEEPDMGTDLGNGVHKIRMAITSKGKGKSGGARVITLVLVLSDEDMEIGLHYIFDRSECENITDKELRDILKRNGIL